MRINFPKQYKKTSQKNLSWGKKHFEAINKDVFFDSNVFRSNVEKKRRNYRSYNGDIDLTAYMALINPNNLSKILLPKQIQHIPIAVPYLNVLLGEELDRRFQFKAICTTPGTIKDIKNKKGELLRNKIKELFEDKNKETKDAVNELRQYMYYLKFTYQDSREKAMNLLLKHHINSQNLKLKFNDGFKDVLISGEEIYMGDIVNDEPVIERLDPSEVTVAMNGDSKRIEDADIILITRYKSIGQLQDKYGSYLSPAEVRALENTTYSPGANKDVSEMERAMRKDAGTFQLSEITKDGQEKPLKGPNTFGNYGSNSIFVDMNGNIRELMMIWKSKKLIYKVKRYDKDTGDAYYVYRDESYIPNVSLGEEVEELYVTQWWEGVQIGEKIYPYIRPRKVQFNKSTNPFYNHPGIVGEVYCNGKNESVSAMDRAFPYQLLYDMNWHKLVDTLSKYMGSLIRVDFATLPPGWDVGKWLNFAKRTGISGEDSFKEGSKGMSTGKLAGSIAQNTGRVIDQNLGDFIQHLINTLEFIEIRLGRIIGVNPQRLGEIANRETVGGVERAVMQSSFSTNEVYFRHDEVKKRVLTLLMELCKITYRDKPHAFQLLADDHMAEIFELNDDTLEEEYGILIDNSSEILELEQKMNELSQFALQNQVLKFTDILKFYTAGSINEKMRILEYGQEEAERQAQEAQEAESKAMQEAQAAEEKKIQIAAKQEMEMHKSKLSFEKYRVDKVEETKRQALKYYGEIDEEKLNIEREKIQAGLEAKVMTSGDLDKQLQTKEAELIIKMNEYNEKVRHNKAKEGLEVVKLEKDRKIKDKEDDMNLNNSLNNLDNFLNSL